MTAVEWFDQLICESWYSINEISKYAWAIIAEKLITPKPL